MPILFLTLLQAWLCNAREGCLLSGVGGLRACFQPRCPILLGVTDEVRKEEVEEVEEEEEEEEEEDESGIE